MAELCTDELMELAGRSPAIHFSTCITITSKSGDSIRPVANILQLRMSEVYEIFQELGIPLRMIACKPRQMGCSTFAQHIVYLHCRKSQCRALVVSDKRDNSADLMEKAKGYEETDCYEWGQTLRSTANEVRFSNGSIIEIYEKPRIGQRYLVACDPATGADQTKSKDPDRTSIQVWRQGYYDPSLNIEHPARMVARRKGPYFGQGDEVAGEIARLSKYYGGCVVVLEVNMGLHVLELLKLEGVHLYRRVVNNAKLKPREEQYGFKLTDRELRRSLIQALATAIRVGEIGVPSEDWYREAKAFVTADNGRDEARAGEHDDDILCSAMSWYCIGAATEYKGQIRRRKKPLDHKDWKTVGSVKRGW